MKKEPKVERSIIIYVWIYCLIVSLVLFLISKNWIWPISFILGTVTSLYAFTLTIRCVDKVIKYDDERKKSTFIKNNILKYVIYMLVLGFSGYTYYRHLHNEEVTKYFNIWCVAAGLLSVKVMIYLKIFIIDKIFKKKASIEYKDEIVTPLEHERLEEERKQAALEEEIEEKKRLEDPFYDFDHKYDEVDKKYEEINNQKKEENREEGDSIDERNTN